jgi:hypothetical protein
MEHRADEIGSVATRQTYDALMREAKSLAASERARVSGNARRRRERWARRYRPQAIDLLLVAEAPPAALDRYFYFPDVWAHDSLFRYVVRSVLGREPDRVSKRDDLLALRAAGVFLIDLCQEPTWKQLRDHVPSLGRRVVSLRPARIVLIKAPVHDVALSVMQATGIPVATTRVPFPGSGNQRRFEVAMAAALHEVGWHRLTSRARRA